MRKILRAGVAIGAFLLVVGPFHQVLAQSRGGGDKHGISHVLLISVDGMHAADYANCANGISTKNNGEPYCPNLAKLGRHGVTYLNSSTSKPSDSFPGLMALVTGGSPRTVGAFYDVAYDRSLSPPQIATGNGLLGGDCVASYPPSTGDSPCTCGRGDRDAPSGEPGRRCETGPDFLQLLSRSLTNRSSWRGHSILEADDGDGGKWITH
jgi:Type I phosphodiesterase / nucleotide pyrophosphatase